METSRWACPRCGNVNEPGTVTCSSCGLDRGASGKSDAGWSEGAAPTATVLGEAAGAEPSQPDVAPRWAVPGDPAVPAAPGAAVAPPRGGLTIGRIVRQFGFLILIGAFAVGAWWLSARRGDDGQITEAGNLASTELRLGDCFDLKDPSADLIDEVDGKPCEETHEYEVFFLGEMADGEFPGDSAFETYVVDECAPAFGEFVGTPYAESELDFLYLVPSEESWAEGDREVVCAVFHPQIDELMGSLRGSKR